MEHHITVSFRDGQRYQFELPDADTADLSWDEAQHWLDEQYVSTGDGAEQSVGTTLLSDKVLRIATACGSRPFAEHTAWARQFARCTGRAMGKIRISVDVAKQSVGV